MKRLFKLYSSIILLIVLVIVYIIQYSKPVESSLEFSVLSENEPCFTYEDHISYEYSINNNSCELFISKKYESFSTNEISSICKGEIVNGISFANLLENEDILYSELIENEVIYDVNKIKDGITITAYVCGGPKRYDGKDDATNWNLYLDIPSDIDGYEVIKIDDFVFSPLNESLEIDENKKVFVNYVYIPETVKYIGKYAFANNNVVTIDIPYTIKNISKYAFYNNYIEELFIPEGVESIETGAFLNNNINDLFIGDSVIYISDNAFDDNFKE